MELTGRNYDFSSLDKVQLSDLVSVFCCISIVWEWDPQISLWTIFWQEWRKTLYSTDCSQIGVANLKESGTKTFLLFLAW